MSKTNLFSESVKLVKNSGLTLEQIAALTGLKTRWVYAVYQEGRIKDPSVHKIQSVYDNLSKMERTRAA